MNVPVPASGRTLACRTSPGLFSADRLDDGTRLLLSNLPAGTPADVLDLGCGWGAIALATAAAFPDARVRAIDRDLLAVRVTAENAAALGLARVRADGGIGLRGLEPEADFDWALCNVPARIGAPAIGLLLASCARRLRPTGSLRVVVIHDLIGTTLDAARAAGLAADVVARSRNHAVVSTTRPDVPPWLDENDLAPYVRDEVEVAGRRLARPHDHGEDPAHLREAVPLLLELLPRGGESSRVAVVRGGYGAIALELAARGARTVAAERDLLVAAFLERNAARHGLTLDVRTAAWLPDALEAKFDLAVVEPAEPMGLASATGELLAVRDRLSPGGRAICLARARFGEALRTATPGARVLVARSGFVALEIRATRN